MRKSLAAGERQPIFHNNRTFGKPVKCQYTGDRVAPDELVALTKDTPGRRLKWQLASFRCIW